MFAWNYCAETFCMLLVVSMVSPSSQKAVNDNIEFRNLPNTGGSDGSEPSKVTRNYLSTKPGSPKSSAVVVIPVNNYEDDPQLILQHPNLMKEIEAELKDQDDNLASDENQDQQHKRQDAGLDSLIQQVFSQSDIQDSTNTDLNDNLSLQSKLPVNLTKDDPANLKQSFPRNPYKIIIIKDGLRQPERNIVNRRRLLKRLRSPMFRSNQENSDSYSKGEHSSDELLHNILESFDDEDPEYGNPIKHAFLTKTTTYNISKLLGDRNNRSFLIEKLVNYSTNLNLLHSENTPTNYSDTHSSVLQTVLSLGQHDTNTNNLVNDEQNGQESYGSYTNHKLPNDIVARPLKSDVSNKKSHELESSPSEFLGGQYLQITNKSPTDTLKPTDGKEEYHRFHDFVGGQFIGGKTDARDNKLLEPKYSKKVLVDFVGGQYVEQPLDLEKEPSGTSSPEFENTSENVVTHHSDTDELATPATLGDETLIHNPLPDFPTKELFDIKVSKEQPSSNVLMPGGKIEKHNSTEEDESYTVNIPKNPYGTNEGEENILPVPKSDITDKQNTPYLSSIDDNYKAQGYNNFPVLSILGTPVLETQTENGYESTTYTDGIQDNVEMLKPLKTDFQIEKKTQAPNPKPALIVNPAKPAKAFSRDPTIIKLTNLSKNKPSSKVSGFNKEKSTTDLLETTVATDPVTLYDDSSLPSETPTYEIKSYSLTKTSDGWIESVEAPNSSSDEVVVASQSNEKGSDLKSKDSLILGLPMRNEDDIRSREESVETPSTSTPTKSDFLSSENEEYYDDSSKAIVGLKPTNDYGNILRTDSATGKVITERVNGDMSDYRTQANSLEELEFVMTPIPILKTKLLPYPLASEFDRVVGEASDIQQSKLRSDPINIKSEDQFSNEEQLSNEQNMTGLVDDVELYAGKSTVSQPVFVDQTTQTYDSETGDVYIKPFVITSIDSSKENKTEFCFPLTGKNYPTLFDLLSGKLYLEKDGKKINLQLKDNPMENCNSGTKVCKLLFDLKKSNEQSISEEMFEISEDNKISKDLDSKSKNGKRQITEEYAELKKPELKTERLAEESNEKLTERIESNEELSGKNEYLIPLIENKTVVNQGISDYNRKELSGFTEAPNSIQPLPVQSMFVRLPVPYSNIGVGEQNAREDGNYDDNILPSQINGEKITLHSLDIPYRRLGFPSGNRLARKIHQKRDSHGQTGGACGCNNPLLLSPSPVPDYRHFVGKRLAILTNIVHAVKHWVAQNP